MENATKIVIRGPRYSFRRDVLRSCVENPIFPSSLHMLLPTLLGRVIRLAIVQQYWNSKVNDEIKQKFDTYLAATILQLASLTVLAASYEGRPSIVLFKRRHMEKEVFI